MFNVRYVETGLLLFPRVEFRVGLFQIRNRETQVAFRGGEGAVPQEVLDMPQIGILSSPIPGGRRPLSEDGGEPKKSTVHAERRRTKAHEGASAARLRGRTPARRRPACVAEALRRGEGPPAWLKHSGAAKARALKRSDEYKRRRTCRKGKAVNSKKLRSDSQKQVAYAMLLVADSSARSSLAPYLTLRDVNDWARRF